MGAFVRAYARETKCQSRSYSRDSVAGVARLYRRPRLVVRVTRLALLAVTVVSAVMFVSASLVTPMRDGGVAFLVSVLSATALVRWRR